MSYEQLEELIEIENEIRGNCPENHTCLGWNYFRIEGNEYNELSEEFGIPYEEKFLLESYAGTTYKYVNTQLRESHLVPPDKFVELYGFYLNQILEDIESVNEGVVWRWHVPKCEFQYLKNKIGKTVQFPEFKSTSIKPKLDCYQVTIQHKILAD